MTFNVRKFLSSGDRVKCLIRYLKLELVMEALARHTCVVDIIVIKIKSLGWKKANSEVYRGKELYGRFPTEDKVKFVVTG